MPTYMLLSQQKQNSLKIWIIMFSYFPPHIKHTKHNMEFYDTLC